MNRWSIYIDIEGFGSTYNNHSKALISLGSLMEGIYLIGSRCFPESPDRLFAHQIGDGFVIVGEYGSDSFDRPVSIAISLLRHVLWLGGTCKASISEGGFADVTGCYPKSIRDNSNDDGVLSLGHGLMTVFPVMGTALINSHRVHDQSPSGSLLVIEKLLIDRLPDIYKSIEVHDMQLFVVDWIHASSDTLTEIETKSGLSSWTPEQLEEKMKTYLKENELSDLWIKNTRQFLDITESRN